MNATFPPVTTHSATCLPPDDALRLKLHDEVHARPPARIRLPALVVCVSVLNDGVSREQECEHLRRLPGQGDLTPESLAGNFVRLRLPGGTLKWERHTEFTRYSLVQALPEEAHLGAQRPTLLHQLVVDSAWLRAVPGRTVAAITLGMVQGRLDDPQLYAQALKWMGVSHLVASQLGHASHSWALADFMVRGDGFERMLVITTPDTSETRVGRISQRLVEMETYRLMALRGLPVAKDLGPQLTQAEKELADITARLEGVDTSEQSLLDDLVRLAAKVERATAEHDYRFSATQAYHGLVRQRIAELREKAIPGTQTLGDFMQRRLSPAMATVEATSRRLASLSERVARTSALLRTRVDIATERQNQQLLEKLTRGQDMQLRLQSTVEGLSIAAISYYVVSLLLYGGKALKALGLPIHPELATGTLIPLVLWAVWKTTRRIHARLQIDH